MSEHLRLVARHVVPRPVKEAILRFLDTSPGHHWLRQTMNAAAERTIAALPPQDFDAAEISGGSHQHRQWRSYRRLEYPEFDLCEPPKLLPGPFDVVICEQVLEHVVNPIVAVHTLHELLRPNGVLIVNTPFLVKVHPVPGDYWRFTPDGLEVLLRAGGFTDLSIGSWGNRWAVTANLGANWVLYRPWHSLRNNPDTPAVVWAVARAARTEGREPALEGSQQSVEPASRGL